MEITKRRIVLAIVVGIVVVGVLALVLGFYLAAREMSGPKSESRASIELDDDWAYYDALGRFLVRGTVTSETDTELPSIAVYVEFCDRFGVKVDSKWVGPESLGPGCVWEFEAISLEKGISRVSALISFKGVPEGSP